MEPINNEQLAMIQLGILISEFITPSEMPTTLVEITQIISENLGVVIKRGERLTDVYNRVAAACKERDEMLVLGELFNNAWMEEELAAALSAEICHEIDKEIIEEIVLEAHNMNFDDAMKGV